MQKGTGIADKSDMNNPPDPHFHWEPHPFERLPGELQQVSRLHGEEFEPIRWSGEDSNGNERDGYIVYCFTRQAMAAFGVEHVASASILWDNEQITMLPGDRDPHLLLGPALWWTHEPSAAPEGR